MPLEENRREMRLFPCRRPEIRKRHFPGNAPGPVSLSLRTSSINFRHWPANMVFPLILTGKVSDETDR